MDKSGKWQNIPGMIDKKLTGIKLILHIGIHKTGTTSIQNFLYNKREILASDYHILYPRTGVSAGCGHPIYPWSIRGIKPPSGEDVDIKHLFQSLLNEAMLYKPECVLLSSEEFDGLRKPDILKLKGVIDYFGLKLEKIICYIRRQDLAIDSFYREVVKNPRSRYKDTFKKYTIKNWVIDVLDYYSMLSQWKKAFPEAEIILRIYDRKLFPDGNVILDFLSVLGIEMPEAREYKIEANPSLSHLSTLVMRRINKEYGLSREDHVKVVNYLFQLDKKEGSPIKTFFTLQERIEFLERFRESNEKLFREYFGTENQFVLSPEEIEFYKEQDKIPKEVIEKAVKERYRKVFEFMKANGILAKEKLFPRVSINYLPTDLDFFRIDVVNANLLNGRLIISGLALPKADVENLKLTIRDAEGMKEVQWGLPSPFFGEQRKDNPIAKNARFRVGNVIVGDGPLEVFVNGKKTAEINITK